MQNKMLQTLSDYFNGKGVINSSNVELLLEGFRYSRVKLLMSVANLSTEYLDFQFDEFSNSIGTLLRHIAGFEYLTQKRIFDARNLTTEEQKFWKGALPGQLRCAQIRKENFSFYEKMLESVRSDTIDRLTGKSDSWLFEKSVFPELQYYTNCYSLFHLIEEEIHHTGQIKLIRTKIIKQIK